jgi:hypothetical protein
MWKTGLLAAVVGLATFAATIVIGRPLVDPDDPTEPTAAAAPVRSWAEQASDRCDDAIASIQAELSSATGLASTAEQAVTLFGITTEIEGRLLRQLRALGRPEAQRRRVEEMLDLLEKQYKRDVATAAKLEQRYDFALLRREVLAYESVAAQMRTLFRRLQAQRCVAYFDPETYG